MVGSAPKRPFVGRYLQGRVSSGLALRRQTKTCLRKAIALAADGSSSRWTYSSGLSPIPTTSLNSYSVKSPKGYSQSASPPCAIELAKSIGHSHRRPTPSRFWSSAAGVADRARMQAQHLAATLRPGPEVKVEMCTTSPQTRINVTLSLVDTSSGSMSTDGVQRYRTPPRMQVARTAEFRPSRAPCSAVSRASRRQPELGFRR